MSGAYSEPGPHTAPRGGQPPCGAAGGDQMWPPPHSWEQSATELARRLPTPSRSRVSLCLSLRRSSPAAPADAPTPLAKVQPPEANGSTPPGPDAPKRAPLPATPNPPSVLVASAQTAPGSGTRAAAPRPGGPQTPTLLPPPRPGTPSPHSRAPPCRSRRQARAYLAGSLRRPLRVRPRSRPCARSEPPSGPPTGRRPPSSPGAAGS